MLTLPHQILRTARAELARLSRIRGTHRRTARRVARAQALAALGAALIGSHSTRAHAFPPIFLDPSFPFGLTFVGFTPRPAFADLDADGDLDALIGAIEGELVYFENSGSARLPTFAPGETNPFGLADVGDFAAPALADVDGDGDLDAFVGSGAGTTVFFANTGGASAPAFAAPTAAFGIPDVGSYAAPALADIDGDGDLDAFVGGYDGITTLFPNTGSASAPAFGSGAPLPFGLTDVSFVAIPGFADLDGDGDLDALLGSYYGTNVFFENTGSATLPAFGSELGDPFGLGFRGLLTAPALADLDADGDLDAVIGEGAGAMFFYRNTGTAAAPAFRPASAAFGLADTLFAPAPEFGDLDGDGDLDALVGFYDGTLKFAANTGTASSPAFGTTEFNPFGIANVSEYASPALGDLDGDGDLDLLVGDANGGGVLALFQNTGTAAAPTFGAPAADPFCAGSLGDRPAPTFTDLGADGDLDLAIGYSDGRLDVCENTGTATLAAFAAPETNPFGLTSVSAPVNSTPVFADLELDGDVDSLRGMGDGGLVVALNSQSTALPFFVPFAPNSFGLFDVGLDSTPALADVDGDGDFDALVGERLSSDITFFENLTVQLLCPPAPRQGCAAFAGGALSVDERKPGKEKLAASLRSGPALAQADFGNPLAAGGTMLGLCLYDGDGGRVAHLEVDRAGALCGTKPCWAPLGDDPPDGKGFAYKDKAAAARGVTALSLKAGAAGKPKLAAAASNSVKKGRTALPTGIAAALAETASVTLQVHATGGACFSATLAEIKKREPDRFKAR